jgi:hypothetical protein
VLARPCRHGVSGWLGFDSPSAICNGSGLELAPVQDTLPVDHMFVKDVASMCMRGVCICACACASALRILGAGGEVQERQREDLGYCVVVNA